MISGTGYEGSQIMLVGDYPSLEDVKNEAPLSGKAESTYSQLLRESHFDIRDTYRTLYVKEGLSYYGKAKGRLKKSIDEAIVKSEIPPDSLLADEIKILKPNVIVPLGDYSLRYLLNHKTGNVSKYRGSVFGLRGDLQAEVDHPVRIIPTISAMDIWSNFQLKVIATLDWRKIVENHDRTDPIKDIGIIWVCRTVEEFNNFCARHYSKSDYLTFDIETYLGMITCISFCFDGHEAISIPLFDGSVDIANLSLLLIQIAKLLSSNIPKVNQNISYDWKVLERYGFEINNIVGDTMLAGHTIYPELPKGLDFLTSIYTEIPYYKDEGKEYNPRLHNKDRLYFYNAKDSLAAHIVHKKQQQELEEQNVKEFHETIVIPLIGIYKEIDEVGINVDMEVRSEIIATYETLFDIHNKTLCGLLERDINPRSSLQVGKLIYEELKFPIRKHQTPNGSYTYSTDRETLEELILFHGDDNERKGEGAAILQQLINCKRIGKIIEYASIPVHPDHRIRTTYKLGGTKTGRTSGDKSIDSIYAYFEDSNTYTFNGIDYNNPDDKKFKLKRIELGGTLQTFPKHGFIINGKTYGKDIRKMYIPSPGHVLIEADLSQAEARVDAVLGRAFDFLELFDKPPGVHRLTGSWIYDCDPFKIDKNTIQYHIAKMARHAGERGMQAKRLSLMVHRPLNECNKILEIFHKNSPHIQGIFHQEVINCVRNNGCLIGPHGRRRDFFGRYNYELFNEAISQLPQETVTDQVKKAMIAVKRRLPWAKLIYEGHDAILGDIEESKIDEYCVTIQEEMERSIDFRNCSLSRDFDLVIPVEIMTSSTNWYEMEIYKK